MIARLLETLVTGFRLSARDNVDPFRFPGQTKPDAVGLRTSVRALTSILRNSSAVAFDDADSGPLLLELCAFRILGGRHFRLSRNDDVFWKLVDSVKDLVVERGVSRAGPYELDLYRIHGIELEAHPMNILNAFLIEEYRFDRSGVVIEAGAGDVVIDGGGCWGDTALYFADRVANGKVFVFEFEPENLEVLRRNLARNPRLASRIEIVERALWSTTGERLKFADAGPATKIGDGEREVESLSIDDFVAMANIPRVDFIKMDIEGAETAALRGAARTIHASAPKLAISAYHSIRDLLSLPQFVSRLRDDYEIHLAHATIHAEETIVFARGTSRAS